MSEAGMLEDFLASACVDAAVFALRPGTAASRGGCMPWR
jgi:hypothetical protein